MLENEKLHDTNLMIRLISIRELRLDSDALTMELIPLNFMNDKKLKDINKSKPEASGN